MEQPPPVEASPYEWAKWYTAQGLVVLPARDKRPTEAWKKYETEKPTDVDLRRWFKGETLRNGRLQMYVVCGRISGVVVLDCDSEEAEQWWAETLGRDVLYATARTRSASGRGHHYWFRLGDKDVDGRSVNQGDMKWDLRAEGGGVVVPPSRSTSGGVYEWAIDFDQMVDWPYPEILDRSEAEGGVPGATRGGSSLAALLANPGEGGRNNWVSKVLGHYAKALKFEDGFRATAEMVWAMASSIPNDHPYDRDEFDRTVNSIWASEQEKWANGKPEASNGWLVSNGQEILTTCGVKDETWLSPFANFDMRAKAIITSEDDVSSYVVDIDTLSHGKLENVTISGEKFGSADQLGRWLSGRRLSLLTPKADLNVNIKPGTRLQLFLEAQNPKRMVGMPWMGWNDLEGNSLYVTEQGVIDSRGLHSLDDYGVIPDPRKTGGSEAAWFYGFDESESVASAVLREVLTFHDPKVTAMFGALWALAPIKGAVMRAASLFPHLAVIAPSEAGKTNGFFDLMLQANGRLNSGATYTPASLRDDMARHRGGFVWIDDPANIDDLGDLLRASAGEGVHTRKGGVNWEMVVRTHLVAPIVISAEGLEMLNERAMADRVVQFEVPSPVGRKSRKGDYPQWDDVVTLMNRGGHLSRFAGHYVKRAWEWLDSVGGPTGLRELMLSLRVGSGRVAEKTAVVRAGARCLHYIGQCDQWKELSIDGWKIGGGEPIDLVAVVDQWAEAEGAADSLSGPYLIEVVLPTLLSTKGFMPSSKSAPVEALFLDKGGCLRVNIPQIATEWSRIAARRPDRARSSQLGSLRALTAESQMLNFDKGVPIKGKRYQVLSPMQTAAVLEKAGYDTSAATNELYGPEPQLMDT